MDFGFIPKKGCDRQDLLAQMAEMRGKDADWEGGRTFSLVYHAGEEHQKLLQQAYSLFIAENFLNPMAFLSLKRMESDVVRMTATMLHGDKNVVGSMTSGGTESILLAVKTYRDRARKRKPWILRPELVAPASIHVAFEKACHYFDVKLVKVPMASDFRVDLDALQKRIGRSTVMIAASAPQFPQGVIDPIEKIGEIAQKRKIPFHVDACIGGFLLPWIEKLGYPVPPFDFRVPGVTSISADVHKYGYASKGASVVVYRDMSYMRHQFFVSTDWTGGIYAGPTMQGTRPGGAIAAAWAAMKFMGENGYLEMAQGAMDATKAYRDALCEIPELRVLGNPDMALVATASSCDEVDIFVVGDLLEAKGWSVDRQQFPDSIHITLTSNHLPVIGQYIADVKEAVATARARPELSAEGKAPMYGMMAKVPLRAMVRMSVLKIMEQMYGPAGDMPDLGDLGGGDKADPLFKLIDRYGPKAMQLFEKTKEIGEIFLGGRGK